MSFIPMWGGQVRAKDHFFITEFLIELVPLLSSLETNRRAGAPGSK